MHAASVDTIVPKTKKSDLIQVFAVNLIFKIMKLCIGFE